MSAVFVTPVFGESEAVWRLIGEVDRFESGISDFVVVDHGPKPVALPQTERLRLHVVRRDPSYWFTAAANEGIRYVLRSLDGASQIVLANSDIRQDQPGTIGRLLRAAESDPESLWAAPAIEADGRIMYSAVDIDWISARFRLRDNGFAPRRLGRQVRLSAVLPTRLIAFSTRIVCEIGLLNEKHLPQYGSDYEWTRRAARRGHGLKIAGSCPIHTERNISTARRGQVRYSPPARAALYDRYWSLLRVGSVRSEFHFSRLVFGMPYTLYWFVVNALRLSAGMVVGVLRYLVRPQVRG